MRAIGQAFPGTVHDGAVDRTVLRQAVVFDPAAMRRLEAILHPMVRQEERAFLQAARRAGHRAAVLDIPLLLETGGEAGKRLDFLIQELHREANTFGSKSAALEITRIGVDMKVLVE